MNEEFPEFRLARPPFWWKWKAIYDEVIKRQRELQEEDDAMSGTERAFSGPNYELELLNDIIRVSTKQRDAQE